LPPPQAQAILVPVIKSGLLRPSNLHSRKVLEIDAARCCGQRERKEMPIVQAQRSDAFSAASTTQKRRLDADLPTRDEIERLIAACSRRAPSAKRNAALLTVAWRCGLRAGELVALQPKDVDLDEGRIVVQCGKGGKRRVVGLDGGTGAMIERWLVARRKLGVGRHSPLFCTLQGGQIDTSYLRHLVKRLARRAGIERRLHPHALRHRFAVDLIQDGADLLVVQRALGHASAATTSTYLSRIGADDAVAFVRQRAWSAS
jgi:integrase/recombinase XerD